MSESVTREIADNEFERLCRAYRIDTDLTGLDKDDIESFDDNKSVIVRAIMRGHMVVNDDGTPVYMPPVDGALPLTFYRPTGATFMAMDEGKSLGGPHQRQVRALTQLTKSKPGAISQLEAQDYHVCSAVLNLFLARR